MTAHRSPSCGSDTACGGCSAFRTAPPAQHQAADPREMERHPLAPLGEQERLRAQSGCSRWCVSMLSSPTGIGLGAIASAHVKAPGAGGGNTSVSLSTGQFSR